MTQLEQNVDRYHQFENIGVTLNLKPPEAEAEQLSYYRIRLLWKTIGWTLPDNYKLALQSQQIWARSGLDLDTGRSRPSLNPGQN